MWELVGADIPNVEAHLKEGYEPFAVSTNSYNFVTVWMKREVEPHEVCCKPEPVKRTSRRVAKKSKG